METGLRRGAIGLLALSVLGCGEAPASLGAASPGTMAGFAIIVQSALSIAAAAPGAPAFLIDDATLRARTRGLPPGTCRRVRGWTTCLASRGPDALGIASDRAGARCAHASGRFGNGTALVAEAGARPRRVPAQVFGWDDFARICETLR